jgi:hypothetical protein
MEITRYPTLPRCTDAMWQKGQTVKDLRDAINASSAANPLWIMLLVLRNSSCNK